MEIRVHQKENLKGSFLVVGFPSRGLVGGIAANYVIDQLRMWPFAGLYDSRLPPTIIVRDGTAYSPIQFFAGAEKCGSDGTCDKLVMCLSEVPMGAELLGDVARAVVAWAKAQGVAEIAVLEGMEAIQVAGPNGAKGRKAKGPAPIVRAVRSMASKVPVGRFGAAPDDETVISSYASAFLLAANELGVDLIAFYTEARKEFPDAHAAAHLLRSLDDMLPNIDLDYGPLEKRARKIEANMRQVIGINSDQLAKMRRATEMMYQ